LLNLFKKFAYISLVKQLIIVERKIGACLGFILASVLKPLWPLRLYLKKKNKI